MSRCVAHARKRLADEHVVLFIAALRRGRMSFFLKETAKEFFYRARCRGQHHKGR
jgi:hypothetical protein